MVGPGNQKSNLYSATERTVESLFITPMRRRSGIIELLSVLNLQMPVNSIKFLSEERVTGILRNCSNITIPFDTVRPGQRLGQIFKLYFGVEVVEFNFKLI